MTDAVYRVRTVDTPHDPPDWTADPDADVPLRADDDVALVVVDGRIAWRGDLARAQGAYPHLPVEDLRDGVLLPGLVDAHVHYPQVRALGGLGLPLLEWLERCALPEEARLADPAYAAAVAEETLAGLAAAGTTSALVFGSHFAGPVDTFFARADASGLRVTTGLVVGDRGLRPDLRTEPDRALAEGRALAARWHGTGRLRYAVTPRFALSATDDLLAACTEQLAEDPTLLLTSHLNENPAEVAAVAALHPGASSYLDAYDRHGLVGPRSVLAHDVHPTDAELARLGQAGAAVAHCPTSNASLGSGLFPLRRHLRHGVRVALGTDVGAGAGFCLLGEARQAYYGQQLLGDDGVALTPARLLHLATRAGAQALGLGEEVGDLSVGKDFDAVLLRPAPGSTLEVVLRHARDAAEVLAALIVLGGTAEVAGVWVGGDRVAGSAARPDGPTVSSIARPRGSVAG